MRESTERDLAVADELGRMADDRIRELEAALILARKMFMYITESTRLTSAHEQAQQGVNVVDGVLAQL